MMMATGMGTMKRKPKKFYKPGEQPPTGGKHPGQIESASVQEASTAQ